MPLRPLDGMRVVDVTTSIAGPYCAEILGALGADVVKVERPDTGDDGRAWGPPFWNGESAMFLAVNAGKRSLAVSLADERGREAVLRLADRADVFLQSLRPGLAERLGLGANELRAPKPAARLLLDRRVRPRRPARAGAGVRRAHAGGGRPHQHDRGARPARRAGRLLAHRHGHGDVGGARDRRRAARARANRHGRRRRHLALRDGARLYRLPPRRLPRRRHRPDAARAPSSRWSRRTRSSPRATASSWSRAETTASSRCCARCSRCRSWCRTSASGRTRIACETARRSSRIVSERLRERATAEWQERPDGRGRARRTGRRRRRRRRVRADAGARPAPARRASGDPGPAAPRAPALVRPRARDARIAPAARSASTRRRSSRRSATRRRRSPPSPPTASFVRDSFERVELAPRAAPGRRRRRSRPRSRRPRTRSPGSSGTRRRGSRRAR